MLVYVQASPHAASRLGGSVVRTPVSFRKNDTSPDRASASIPIHEILAPVSSRPPIPPYADLPAIRDSQTSAASQHLLRCIERPVRCLVVMSAIQLL